MPPGSIIGYNVVVWPLGVHAERKWNAKSLKKEEKKFELPHAAALFSSLHRIASLTQLYDVTLPPLLKRMDGAHSSTPHHPRKHKWTFCKRPSSALRGAPGRLGEGCRQASRKARKADGRKVFSCKPVTST